MSRMTNGSGSWFEIEKNTLMRYHGQDALVTVPDGVTQVGRDAFERCGRLERVYLPDSVTELARGAFRECAELRAVSLPGSLRNAAGEAFAGCGKASLRYRS